MYPTAVPPSSGVSGALGGLLGAVFTGGLITILILIAAIFLSYYVFYRVVRAAVRDGVTDAQIKSGGFGSGGGFVNGYPPAQSEVGPPPAPGYGQSQYPGYRGPNG